MYLIYLYIACTGYWKTNFNSQDWLIESFLNKISLNYFFQEGTVQYDWFWCGPDFPISAQGHGDWWLYSQIHLVLWMRESCVLVQFSTTWAAYEHCQRERESFYTRSFLRKYSDLRYNFFPHLLWPLGWQIPSSPALQVPHYYGQFTLSLGKGSPYIFSKFYPLNTLRRLVCMDTFYSPGLSIYNNTVWP